MPRLSKTAQNEVKHKTMYTHSSAGALRLLAYKCNPLIVKRFLFRVKRNRSLISLFSFCILQMSFFNSETILLIDKRNLFKVVRADTVTLKLISNEMLSATESRELHKVPTTFDRQHRARVYY